MTEEKKPVHTIVLDAGPLIANTPSISTLLKKSEEIFTTPSVIGEIKDATARARLDTLVMPFITLRTPNNESMRFVTEFARKTGDLPVLSKTDLEIIALAYELECEQNGGDWRLRKTPGQKTVNGPPPLKSGNDKVIPEATSDQVRDRNASEGSQGSTQENIVGEGSNSSEGNQATQTIDESGALEYGIRESSKVLKDLSLDDGHSTSTDAPQVDTAEPNKQGLEAGGQEQNNSVEALSPGISSDSEPESDGGEWITPSNITRHKVAATSNPIGEPKQEKTLKVATLTTDHTLQNTLLLINLNLLSSSLTRIAHIKSHILRCHACFATTKQMEKQFCPRCGQAALTRVTTSTNANGTTTLHLKKNMQWNTRGDRYSIPKPVAGTANGKMREKGGGKGGWGRDLILAEDQKEYVRAVKDKEREKRRNEKDMLDQDYLPGLMSGERSHGTGGRIQIGAGRSINSKKRK